MADGAGAGYADQPIPDVSESGQTCPTKEEHKLQYNQYLRKLCQKQE